MIVKHNLGVVRRINLCSGHVFILFNVRIHIYNLTISFVPEKKSRLSTPRINFKVRTIV